MTTEHFVFEPSQAEATTIDLGKAEWKRKQDGADWHGWVQIGHALDTGRKLAMKAVYTNRPQGKPYNMAFGTWLKQNGFEGMEGKLRANLLVCIDNLLAVEAWRRSIGATKAAEWNHPTVVLRRWQASLKVSENPAQQAKMVKAQGMHAALAALEEKNTALEARNKQLEDRDVSGSLFVSSDAAWQIGEAIANELRTVSDTKFDEILVAAKSARRKQRALARPAKAPSKRSSAGL